MLAWFRVSFATEVGVRGCVEFRMNVQRLSVLTLTLMTTVRANSPLTRLLFSVLTCMVTVVILWCLCVLETRITDLLTQVKRLVTVLFLNLFHIFQLAPHSD